MIFYIKFLNVKTHVYKVKLIVWQFQLLTPGQPGLTGVNVAYLVVEVKELGQGHVPFLFTALMMFNV
jgi:hypothetical protein